MLNRIRLFPKIIIFGVFLFAMSGTYRYMFQSGYLRYAPHPIPVIAWTPDEPTLHCESGLSEIASCKIIGVENIFTKVSPVKFPLAVAAAWLMLLLLLAIVCATHIWPNE